MAKEDSLPRLAILLLFGLAARGNAQIVETPVAFDSAQKVRSLTPALVRRFDLKPPAWPVTGDFTEARLYAARGGDHVLVVERVNREVERYGLDSAQVSVLRAAIDSAMVSRTGGIVAEPSTEREDVSRGAFLRNQMILSAGVYGPLIAAFADDGQTATALYLLSTGASVFIVNGISKNTRVTRVQNDLATDGAIRGFLAATGLMASFGGNDIPRQTYSAIGLAGSIGGSVAGYRYGARLTDSEAQAARKISTLAAATAFTALGAAGALEPDNAERSVFPAMVAAGGLGYFLGPMYVRRAKYTVTAGDVRLLPLGALIGLGAGLTPFADGDGGQGAWTAMTLGMVGGALLANQGWVRPFDNAHSDATLTWLGATGGTLIGAAVAILTDAQDASWSIGMLTTGTFVGALAGHAIANPPRANARSAMNIDGAPRRGVQLQFDPASLAFAAAKTPGRHALFTVRF